MVFEFLRSSASFSGVYSPAAERWRTATGTGFFGGAMAPAASSGFADPFLHTRAGCIS